MVPVAAVNAHPASIKLSDAVGAAACGCTQGLLFFCCISVVALTFLTMEL